MPELPDSPPPAGRLSVDRAREAVDEIVRLLSSCPPELRTGLRRVAEIVAGAFDDRPAMAEDLRSGLKEKPSRALRLQTLSADRAQELLAADSETRARAVRSDGERIVRGLAAGGRPDLILRLLTGVSGMLGDPSPLRRRGAIDSLHAIQGVWDDPGFASARPQLEKDLRRSLERETDGAVYARLADFTGFIVASHLRRDEIRPAVEVISLLVTQQPTHEAAGQALELLLGGGALDAYASRILAGEPAALQLLEAFGDAAPRHLLLQIRLCESAPARSQLGRRLARCGAGGAALLAEELGKPLGADEALRLLDVLPLVLSDAEATSVLGLLLRHASVPVRAKAVDLLAERSLSEAGDFLLRALQEEKDATLRIGIVEALGRVRAASAVDDLSAIAEARQEGDEIREAACAALGCIGGPDALEALSALATRSSHGLAALLRPPSPAVRRAALHALGAFVADSGIRRLLEKAADDNDPVFASAAREALTEKLQHGFLKAGASKPPTARRLIPKHEVETWKRRSS